MSIKEEKSLFRHHIIDKRRRLGKEKMAEYSQIICDRIRLLPEFKVAKTIAAFSPTEEEVNISPLLQELLDDNKIVAFPRVVSPGVMIFHSIDKLDKLVCGFKGITEPAPDAPIIRKNTFDFVFVPAVAIDFSQKRLGYGGGFYDRFLPIPCSAFLCSPIFSCQQVESLPTEDHDWIIDIVISEREN